MKLTLGQVADWIHAEGDFTTNTEALGYSIDSRTIAAGELFFAVTGERVDGHDYVETALANGAVAAVVSHRWLASDDPRSVDLCKLLWVPEGEDCVLEAMQTLAHQVRRAWGKRVIGVTGSAGKTTTKEAVAEVLSSRFTVLKSAGNLNNHFGVPLQLLRLEPEHDVAVIEMGMNHAGELAALGRMVEPDWAVVSNVGTAHLEFFPDGIEGIAQAKYELVQAIPADGLAILNADDERVTKFARGLGERAVMYGTDPGASVRATEILDAGAEGLQFTVSAGVESAHVVLPMLGRHNVLNALAAIAVGLRSGIPLIECAAAIGRLRAPDKRGEVVQVRGVTLINDCYNSNPAALDAMVDALRSMPVAAGGRRIVIAGEMLELGPESAAMHWDCGARMGSQMGAGAVAQRIEMVVGVRGLATELVAGATSEGVASVFIPSARETGAWMRENLRPGDVVLLKASRGVRLEDAVAVFAADESDLPG